MDQRDTRECQVMLDIKVLKERKERRDWTVSAVHPDNLVKKEKGEKQVHQVIKEHQACPEREDRLETMVCLGQLVKLALQVKVVVWDNEVREVLQDQTVHLADPDHLDH